MRKHLLRLLIAYTCFELFRRLGGELPEWFRGEQTFAWVNNKRLTILRSSNFFLFFLYPLSAYIIFHKYFRQNKQKAIIYFLAAALSIITLRYLLEEILFIYLFGFHNYYDGVPLIYYYVDNTYYAVVYSAFGILYFLLVNEQQRKLEQSRLELENKKTQLSFLKSQINPHFLFNSLNNVYSLVYQNSPQSLEAVSKLCDMLRYMLYEDQMVRLSKETGYINLYIDLQKLRFDNLICIKQKTEGDVNNTFIAPLILIPFVENAFKHGDFKHPDVHIEMELKVINNTINFSILNKKSNKEKDEGGGIGLQNIKKRLELLYPAKHNLQITDSSDTFKVSLQLIT